MTNQKAKWTEGIYLFGFIAMLAVYVSGTMMITTIGIVTGS